MRIVAAVAVIVAASLPASPLAAQDDVVLHEFVYSPADIGAALADRPDGVPADGLTVEFEPGLMIRTSGSAVTAVFTDLAFSGTMADGCSSRLAYSVSSTEIAARGDGVFDVTLEGYWDWQYTVHEAAGDICPVKEQSLTEISGTITVRMIDGTPFVDDALGIPVPLESFAPDPPTVDTAGTVLDQPADDPDPTASVEAALDDAGVGDSDVDTAEADTEMVGTETVGPEADQDSDGWSPPVLLIIALIICIFGLLGYLIIQHLAKRSPAIRKFVNRSYMATLDDGYDHSTDEPRQPTPVSAPASPPPDAPPGPGYAWVWAPVTKELGADDAPVRPDERTVLAGEWYQGRRDADGRWTIREINGNYVAEGADPETVRLPET